MPREQRGACRGVQEVDAFLTQQPVDALPGVGWAARGKLEGLGVTTVAQLRVADKAQVAQELGQKTADELARFAWGHDDREARPRPLPCTSCRGSMRP